jgi:predicted SprT family Zn-dependent metalloprotease
MRSARNARHIHRPQGGDAPRQQVTSLVALIRSAIASGVISGELAQTVREWARLWRVPEFLDGITFRQNARLRTTIARWAIESNCVEVSTRFFELRRDHREILCHELAHAAAVRMHGRVVRPHGPEWCDLVRKAGYEPKAHLASDRRPYVSPSDIQTQLDFEHRCPVCHAVRFARKLVKSWRCVECVGAGLPGHLTIRVVPRGGAAQ